MTPDPRYRYFLHHVADDSFGNLIEVPLAPFIPHPQPRFPGETTASGAYAWIVSDWIFRDINP